MRISPAVWILLLPSVLGGGCAGKSISHGSEAGAGKSGGGAAAGSESGRGTGGTGGTPPDYAACTSSDQCVVTWPGCCPNCTPQSVESFVAINARWVGPYSSATCDPGGSCDVCAHPALRAPYAATCIEDRCTTFDVRATRATLCDEDSDCRLRAGLRCCEDCFSAIDTLVAISDEEALLELVCGPNVACDDCVPTYNPAAFPACIEGRCTPASTHGFD